MVYSNPIPGKTPYDLGKEILDSELENIKWVKLDKKHPDWECIDWNALYKAEARLLHRPTGTIIKARVIIRKRGTSKNPIDLWLETLPKLPYLNNLHGATQAALDNAEGWELYIKDKIPTRVLTADELAPGTCFLGKLPNVNGWEEIKAVVVEQSGITPNIVIFANSNQSQPAAEIEVIEAYGIGTFKKPGEDA